MKLHSERFYLYRADEESPMTVRLTVRMKDAVDGQMLREAVADTQKRYPYFCVRLGVYNDEQGIEHAAFDDNHKSCPGQCVPALRPRFVVQIHKGTRIQG